MQRPFASPFEHAMRTGQHCSRRCHRRLVTKMRMARLRRTRSKAVLACRTACNVPSSRWRHSCWQEVAAKSRPQRQLCHKKNSVKVSSAERQKVAKVSENEILL